jgi:prevent-host-death family protein
MTTKTIPTRTMKFTEARPHLSELLNRVHDKELRLKVTKGNLPVAAIVSVEDLERLNQLDAQREREFRVFDEIGAAFADETPEQIEREVATVIAQVRANRQRDRQSNGTT